MKMYGYCEPYQATGCVLSGEEFAYFLQKYTAKHPDCDITEDTLDEVYLNEYDFERSDNKGFFEVADIGSDEADGMYLCPFALEKDPKYRLIDLRGMDQYVVFSDHNPGTLEFMEHPMYNSYTDILKEFKGKLKEYLPEDFSWDKHIGRIFYTVYCYTQTPDKRKRKAAEYVSVEHISVLDKTVKRTSKCIVDVETKKILCFLTKPYDVDADSLEDEYVLIDRKKYPAVRESLTGKGFTGYTYD